MSAWSDAFTEVFNETRPDLDPKLTYGGGSTADGTKEFDKILLISVRGVTWATGLTLTYGQIVFPTVRNGHRYRVTTGGVTGSTEPTWGTSEYSSVSDNGVVLVEDGTDFGSIYDTRLAKYRVLDNKVKQAMNQDQYIGDARATASSYLYLNLQRERDKYMGVGVS